jgi:predicted Zn finger-like uncharacterized protein
MNLTCPHCGFSKEVDPDRIPARVSRVTCPRCQQGFSLEATAAAGPSGEVAPAVAEEQIPPAPPVSTLAESDQLSAEALPKAGFWIRLVAALVDSALVLAAQLILGFALGLATAMVRGGLSQQGELLVGVVTWFPGMILSMVYYVFFTGYCGQTPGKMAVRAKVIRTDGHDIGYGRAFLREVPGKFLSGLILGIGYLMIAFDSQKQGLHDKIADTYVIKL